MIVVSNPDAKIGLSPDICNFIQRTPRFSQRNEYRPKKRTKSVQNPQFMFFSFFSLEK